MDTTVLATLNKMVVPPPLGEALRGALLEEVEESITQRQYTVAQYITTRPILDIYQEAVRQPGMQVVNWW